MHGSPSALRCTSTRTVDGTLELALAGEIDLGTAGLLEGWLGAAQAGGAPIVLDLAEVVFFDSAGVKALLHAAARAPVTVRRPRRSVRRTLAITGVDRVIAVDPRPAPG
jgi:anti-anti-sigma factor